MADFCQQCSISNFGKDFGDFAGMSTEDDTKDETYTLVLCEGCGPTCVDHNGKCVCHDCLEKHQ